MVTWWILLTSFCGGLLGSGLPAWSAWRTRRQEARTEWRQRLGTAIELITSDSEAKRQIGDELLSDLVDSDLGSDSDRALAYRVADIRIRHDGPAGITEMDGPDPVLDPGREEEVS